MRRIITILTAIAICTRLAAQPGLDGELMSLEKRVFSCSGEGARAELILQKLDCYFKYNNFSRDAVNEARRIDFTLLADPLSRQRFLWNAALLFYLNNEKDASMNYFSAYQEMASDTSIPALLLGTLIQATRDSAYAAGALAGLSARDTALACLRCLPQVTWYERPHKNRYVLASALVPGLGTMLNGNFFKGFNSLSVNTAAVLITAALIKNNLYANAFLLGGALCMKFYSGNIRLTQKLFEQKEAVQKNTLAVDCERMLKKTLDKYPLSFR